MKRAQFFIITSLIVTIIIAGLTSIVNYAVTQPEPIKFYDLSEHYEAEATKVIDSGVYYGKSEAEIKEGIENFTKDYLEYAQERDPNLELIYIYGNAENVTIANYRKGSAIGVHTGEEANISIEGGLRDVVSKVSYGVGERQFSRDVVERMEHFKKVKEDIQNPGDWVRIDIAGALHDFNLQEGNTFYFILETTMPGNETIVTELKYNITST
jgi:hypothetical protein